MPIEIAIVAAERIAYAKAWGELSSDELLEAGVSILGHESWEPGFDVVLDYGEVLRINTDRYGVRRVVAQDRRAAHLLEGSRCVVVARRDAVFGVSRMWELLSSDSDLQRRVVRTLDEAAAWLGRTPEILASVAPPTERE